MISNPSLILYACVAKGPIILAEFSSKELGSDPIAHRCIEKTPPHHSMFSHTVSNRTYTFLMDHPFAYFGIFDEKLDKSESLWFLNRLKCAFEDLLETGLILSTDNLSSNCLQSNFNPIFSEIMALDLDLPTSPGKGSRNPSLDSTRGRRTALTPLLGKQIKGLKKKKRLFGDAKADAKTALVEKNVDVLDDANGTCKDFKGGCFFPGDRQKAKQIWKKHVWVVLTLDLIVCAALFGIWLWVCKGFQCIDG